MGPFSVVQVTNRLVFGIITILTVVATWHLEINIIFGNKYYTSSSTYPDNIISNLKTDNKIIEMMTCSNADAFPTWHMLLSSIFNGTLTKKFQD